ncbi:hypothetical protein JL721_7678 [Aureococcus anophagefferens]|nr:hypothetical protein JL721_7678 [Aureococcus anophagefferens]
MATPSLALAGELATLDVEAPDLRGRVALLVAKARAVVAESRCVPVPPHALLAPPPPVAVPPPAPPAPKPPKARARRPGAGPRPVSGKFKCDACPALFDTSGALSGHRRFCDGGKWRCACGATGPPTKTADGKYLCDHCGRSHDTLGSLASHARRCDGGHWRCDWCKITDVKGKNPGPRGPATLCGPCGSRYRGGATGPPTVDAAGKFVCDACGQKYDTLAGLSGHAASADAAAVRVADAVELLREAQGSGWYAIFVAFARCVLARRLHDAASMRLERGVDESAELSDDLWPLDGAAARDAAAYAALWKRRREHDHKDPSRHEIGEAAADEAACAASEAALACAGVDTGGGGGAPYEALGVADRVGVGAALRDVALLTAAADRRFRRSPLGGDGAGRTYWVLGERWDRVFVEPERRSGDPWREVAAPADLDALLASLGDGALKRVLGRVEGKLRGAMCADPMACTLCGTVPDGGQLLLCDGAGDGEPCAQEWCLACAGVADVPDGDWFCAKHKPKPREKEI